MNQAAPKVTVLMAVRDGERYLASVLDCVLGQTLRDLEFVVVNDASSDRTVEMLAACPDPRLRVVHNQVNLGMAASLNRGLAEARGEYVARHDADDLSVPERLTRQAEYLDRQTGCGLVSCLCQRIDEDDRPLWKYNAPQTPRLIRWRILLVNPFVHSAAMFRRKLVQDLGGYDPFFEGVEDYDLWSKINAVAELGEVPEVLAAFRLWPSSYSKRNHERQQNFADLIRQRNIGRFLGREIPLEQARWLHRGDGGRGECRPTLALYAELYRRFVAQERPAPGEVKEIRRDLALAAQSLVRRYALIEPAAAWRAHLAAARWGWYGVALEREASRLTARWRKAWSGEGL